MVAGYWNELHTVETTDAVAMRGLPEASHRKSGSEKSASAWRSTRLAVAWQPATWG
jgi:hypothetical protein